jgi:hypothetical protein
MGFWPETPDTCLGGTCSAPGGRMPISMPPAAKFASTMGLLRTSLGVIHNGVCPCVHVKNHQIRVKIDQKGDVFRQKGIKKARISSCPS